MKTAIVEIRESHEECICTQLSFLKDAGHKVTLILHPILAQQITDYANLADEVIYFDFDHQDFFKKLRLQWQLFGMLKKFDLIVFNTAHSYSVVRNLTVLLRFAEVACVGILHDTKKLLSSSTQSIISQKVKKYFVLNDALLPLHKNTGAIKVQSFYPIFFPEYEPLPVYKQNDIWIGIPGRVDYDRRDYDFLVNAIAEIPTLDRVKFIILGKVDRNNAAGKRFYDSLEKSGQLGRFKLFHSFVENRDFHSYLAACDYIMPLLKPNADYLKYKISGTFNLAFAHKKTMLCHTFFQDIPDLKENSCFFDPATFPQLISDIDTGNLKSPATYSDPKWSYRFQQSRYIDFINE
ncbi:hypothetical protein [Pricia sp.]|uniref:hypothetical protein n=1 Tax=Pricia sp. TaxID=2268138 RepID=UPI003593B8E3